MGWRQDDCLNAGHARLEGTDPGLEDESFRAGSGFSLRARSEGFSLTGAGGKGDGEEGSMPGASNRACGYRRTSLPEDEDAWESQSFRLGFCDCMRLIYQRCNLLFILAR